MFAMNIPKSSSPNVQKLFSRAKVTTISFNVFICFLILSQLCFTVPVRATEKCGGVKSRYVCDDKDPSVFHICLGNNHFTMVCPGMLHFNWRTQTCDWPSETDCVKEIANNPRPPQPVQPRPRQSYSPPVQRAPPKPQPRPVSPPRSALKPVTQSPRTNPPRVRNQFPQRNIAKPRQPAPRVRNPVTPRTTAPRTTKGRKAVTQPQAEPKPTETNVIKDEDSDTITDVDDTEDFDATIDHDVMPRLKVISRDPDISYDEEFDSSALEELGIGHLIVPFKASVPGRDPSLANDVHKAKTPVMHGFRKTTPKVETPVTWYEKYEIEHSTTPRKGPRRISTTRSSSSTWYDKAKETPPPHSVYRSTSRSGSTSRQHDTTHQKSRAPKSYSTPHWHRGTTAHGSQEPSEVEVRTMSESRSTHNNAYTIDKKSQSNQRTNQPSSSVNLSTKIPSWTTTISLTEDQPSDKSTRHQVSSEPRTFKATTLVHRTSPVKSSQFSSDMAHMTSSSGGKQYISSSPFRPPPPKNEMYWPTTKKQDSQEVKENSVSHDDDSSNQNHESVKEDKSSTRPGSNEISEKPSVKLSPYRPQAQSLPSKAKSVSLSPFSPPSVKFRPTSTRYNSATPTKPRASTFIRTAGDMRDDLKTSAKWYETSPLPNVKDSNKRKTDDRKGRDFTKNRSKRPFQRPVSPFTPPPYLKSTHFRKTTLSNQRPRTTVTRFDTRQKSSTSLSQADVEAKKDTKSKSEPWYTKTTQLLKETKKTTLKQHTHKHETSPARESIHTTRSRPSVSAAASTRRVTTRPTTSKSKTMPWWSSVKPTTRKSSRGRFSDEKRNWFPKRYGVPKPNYHTRTPSENFGLLPSEHRSSSYKSSLRQDTKNLRFQPVNAAASTDKRFSLHKNNGPKERTFSLHKRKAGDPKFALHKPKNNRPVNAPAATDEKFSLHSPEQAAKTKIDTYKSPIFNYKTKKGKCSSKWCKLPNCRCIGKDIPGDLKAKEVPQMVLLTFDDSINFQNMKYYKEMFNGSLKNPNGCPIKSTFFVSGDNSDYGMVRSIYKGGHEIASHTLSHRNPTTWWAHAGYDNWENEVVGMRQRLHEKAGVPLDEIKGMRAPFLQVGGDAQFAMLKENKFRYDSSMVTGNLYSNNDKPMWPFTLDTAPDSQTCSLTPCPTRSYPGLWEVPLVRWYGSNEMACAMPDACTIGVGATGSRTFIEKNFKRHYMTNRAPLGIFIHASWFGRQHGNFEGLVQFLQSLKGRDDVWVVTVDQALDWIQRPVRLSAIDTLKSWRC